MTISYIFMLLLHVCMIWVRGHVLVFSFHLNVGSEDQVSRFSWQAPLPARLSCPPSFSTKPEVLCPSVLCVPKPYGSLNA